MPAAKSLQRGFPPAGNELETGAPQPCQQLGESATGTPTVTLHTTGDLYTGTISHRPAKMVLRLF